MVLSNGELQAPKTVTPAELEGVGKICGSDAANAVGPGRKEADARSKQGFHGSVQKHQSFRSRAVAKVVACLHKEGVNIPRSDSALLSSTSGIKTRIPRVKAAIGKCRSEL